MFGRSWGRIMSQTIPTLGANQQFCRSCGQVISSLAPTCPHCGPPPAVKAWPAGASPKSRLAALLLCWFLGMFGAHRFYVGKIGTGILRYVRSAAFGAGIDKRPAAFALEIRDAGLVHFEKDRAVENKPEHQPVGPDAGAAAAILQPFAARAFSMDCRVKPGNDESEA